MSESDPDRWLELSRKISEQVHGESLADVTMACTGCVAFALHGLNPVQQAQMRTLMHRLMDKILASPPPPPRVQQ